MEDKKPSRDKTKYRYFMVGINIDNTELLERLEQDRKRLGLRYISQVIAARMGDYYELKDSITHHMSTNVDTEPDDMSDDLDALIGQLE